MLQNISLIKNKLELFSNKISYFIEMSNAWYVKCMNRLKVLMILSLINPLILIIIKGIGFFNYDNFVIYKSRNHVDYQGIDLSYKNFHWELYNPESSNYQSRDISVCDIIFIKSNFPIKLFFDWLIKLFKNNWF